MSESKKHSNFCGYYRLQLHGGEYGICFNSIATSGTCIIGSDNIIKPDNMPELRQTIRNQNGW